MAGQFSPTARPVRAGAYFNFQAAVSEPVLVNTLGIVALPFTHSWGPANQIVTLNSWADFTQFYSQGGTTPPAYTPGYIAVRQAFQGEGLPGRGGAGQVLAYRIVGAAGLASSLVLQNTSAAPAITLTAVYQGTYGNNISVTVAANARNPTTQCDLTIFVNGTAAETFTYNKTDITSLSVLINDPNHGSKWVVASAVTSGTALTLISSPTPLAGGNDGSTLVAGDWTTLMAAYGVTRFGVFAPYDLESGSILASLFSWGQGINVVGKRTMFVTGGASNDTATTATARAATMNDPNFITIGVGTFSDSTLGALNTAQLVPRLAGIIAARTEQQGLSFARLAGLSIVAGASDSDILASLQGGGFMTISRDSNAVAPVRFEKGLTTYSVFDGVRPVSIYSNPKFVLTMQNLEREITEWAESNVIGRLPVNAGSLSYLIGNVKTRLKSREIGTIIQPGWTVIQSPTPVPTPQDDFFALLYSVTFGRDLEQVLNTVVVS